MKTSGCRQAEPLISPAFFSLPTWWSGRPNPLSTPRLIPLSSLAPAGAYTPPPELVRIAPPGAHPPAASGPRPLDPAHFPSQPGEPHPPAVPQPPPPILDLAVNLEYDSGCHRSHSRSLPVPVLQPFSAHVAARELPCGAIALQLTLQSNLAVPLTLTSASLAPQPGLALKESLAGRLGLLPLRLPAGASAGLAFMLQLSDSLAGASLALGGGRLDRAAAGAKLAQAAKLQPSVLSVEYELDSAQLCGAPAPALALPGGAGEGAGAGSALQLAAGLASPTGGAGVGQGGRPGAAEEAAAAAAAAVVARCPPLEALQELEQLAAEGSEAEDEAPGSRGSSPTRRGSRLGSPTRRDTRAGGSGSGGGGSREVQRCSFTHLLVLQLAPPEGDSQGGQPLAAGPSRVFLKRGGLLGVPGGR